MDASGFMSVRDVVVQIRETSSVRVKSAVRATAAWVWQLEFSAVVGLGVLELCLVLALSGLYFARPTNYEGYVMLLNLPHFALWATAPVALTVRNNPWAAVMSGTGYVIAGVTDSLSIWFRASEFFDNGRAIAVLRVIFCVTLMLVSSALFVVMFSKQANQFRELGAFYRKQGLRPWTKKEGSDERTRLFEVTTLRLIQIAASLASFDFSLSLLGFLAYFFGLFPGASGSFSPAFLFAGHLTLWFVAMGTLRNGYGIFYPPTTINSLSGITYVAVVHSAVIVADLAGLAFHIFSLVTGRYNASSIGFSGIVLRWTRWLWTPLFVVFTVSAILVGSLTLWAQLRDRRDRRHAQFTEG